MEVTAQPENRAREMLAYFWDDKNDVPPRQGEIDLAKVSALMALFWCSCRCLIKITNLIWIDRREEVYRFLAYVAVHESAHGTDPLFAAARQDACNEGEADGRRISILAVLTRLQDPIPPGSDMVCSEPHGLALRLRRVRIASGVQDRSAAGSRRPLAD
jgi:hypothetical protein